MSERGRGRAQGYACALCERTGALHIHHNIPRSAGGSNELGNLICLCPACHAIAHREYTNSPLTRAWPWTPTTTT